MFAKCFLYFTILVLHKVIIYVTMDLLEQDSSSVH